MGLWGKESTYTKLLQRISEKNAEGLELHRQSLQNGQMYHWSQQHPEKHIERFAFMMNRCDEREIEFALHMIEQILRGQEDYLSE